MKCSLCGSTDTYVLLSQDGTSLISCRSCKVAYLQPFPAPQAGNYFKKSGTADYRDPDDAFARNRAPSLSSAARAILQIVPAGTVLDIGCATGDFLSEYFVEGWEKHGVELSPSFSEVASRKGIRVHCGPLESADYPPRTFNAVIVFDALYYFPDPRSLVRHIGPLLNNDGILAIELPNAWARLRRLGTAVFEKSDHLLYYRPESVVALLKSEGYSIKEVMPLPSNRHDTLVKRMIYAAYDMFASVVWHVSAKRVILASRFLVIARKPE